MADFGRYLARRAFDGQTIAVNALTKELHSPPRFPATKKVKQILENFGGFG